MARVAAGCKIILNGNDLKQEGLHSFIIDSDIDQPDMCVLVLQNTSEYNYSQDTKQGDTLEIKIGPDDAKAGFVFKGEIIGIEPIFDAGSESRVTIRAFKDRKSTRLNSSHSQISYAVFCLKKKKKL